MQPGVKFKPITIYPELPKPGVTRYKQPKVTVEMLPFPYPRALHTSKWQKVFRPTLLSWAASWPDPYSTNTLLDEEVVLEMWDMMYDDIELDKQERMDTGVKLVHLVSNFYMLVCVQSHLLPGRKHSPRLAHCHWDRSVEHRQELLSKPGQQSGQQGAHRKLCAMGP
jgi:hypothetical protein